LRWKLEELGSEKDLLLTKIRNCVSNVMSSALSWHYHDMLTGAVIYCLMKYQVATSGLLHIVIKFYMKIMPLRLSEIQNFKFPRTGDIILAGTQTAKV
jgi:hypothetical protein